MFIFYVFYTECIEELFYKLLTFMKTYYLLFIFVTKKHLKKIFFHYFLLLSNFIFYFLMRTYIYNSLFLNTIFYDTRGSNSNNIIISRIPTLYSKPKGESVQLHLGVSPTPRIQLKIR